jgi:serine/threonine protein kinase
VTGDPTDDPTQSFPMPNVIAGRYRLDELVGRGGTAEVWRATDTQLDRVVALKLVTVAHDDSSARAADEARTLAQLSHPNLVQVYDAGTDASGRPWVVMEFVDGQTLADAIRRGPLPVAKVADIGIAVADALAHVHAMGLVHRDVKPANVLLGKTIKLTDFGIARLVDAAKVTSTGLMVGTASYLSPEQVAGEPVGPAVDVYALGLLLLETLTGTREYDGPAVEAAMARLSRPPTLPASLPPGWAGLIAGMTARQAADRPTASQVAQHLRAMESGATTVLPTYTQAVPAPVDRTTAMPQTRTTARPAAVPVPVRKSKAPLYVGLMVAAIVLGGGVGVVISQSGDKATPRQVPSVNDDLPTSVSVPLKEFVRQEGSK